MRGGKRPGAGRKPATGEALSKVVRARVTPAEAQQLVELGGADWLPWEIDRMSAALDWQRELGRRGNLEVTLNSDLANPRRSNPGRVHLRNKDWPVRLGS